MFKMNLKAVLAARGIANPFTWLMKAGMSRHSAARFLYTDVREIKLDHLEFLCRHLVCDLRDLLKWVPGNEPKLPADHPLLQHNREMEPLDWTQTLASMPLEQLQELKRAMVEKGKAAS